MCSFLKITSKCYDEYISESYDIQYFILPNIFPLKQCDTLSKTSYDSYSNGTYFSHSFKEYYIISYCDFNSRISLINVSCYTKNDLIKQINNFSCKGKIHFNINSFIIVNEKELISVLDFIIYKIMISFEEPTSKPNKIISSPRDSSEDNLRIWLPSSFNNFNILEHIKQYRKAIPLIKRFEKHVEVQMTNEFYNELIGYF